MKTRLGPIALAAAVMLAILATTVYPQSQRGKVDYDQIASAARKGTGSQFQMFGGGSTTTGDMAVYDASGNVIDGGPPGSPTTNQNIRSFGASFDGGGSALTTSGATVYLTVPFACTLAAWDITVDTGTISFDVWKVATGTAIPTISNTILSGGFLSLSTGTAIHSTTLTDFTTTGVSANDIMAVNIEAVSSATKASLVISCKAN